MSAAATVYHDASSYTDPVADKGGLSYEIDGYRMSRSGVTDGNGNTTLDKIYAQDGSNLYTSEQLTVNSNTGYYHYTSVTFTLCLEDLQQMTNDTMLIELGTTSGTGGSATGNGTGSAIGLIWTSQGLKASWQGFAWGSSQTVSLDTLNGLAYTENGGHKYITMTYVINYGGNGTSLYDHWGNLVQNTAGDGFSMTGLRAGSTSEANNTHKALGINTNYINDFAITAGAIAVEDMSSLSFSVAPIPEPATTSKQH